MKKHRIFGSGKPHRRVESGFEAFTYDPEKNNFTVPKGSISVNGVSLTVVDSEKGHLQGGAR